MRSSSCRPTARCCSSPARSPARARSTRRPSRRSAEVGPQILHISGERDYWSLKSRVRRADYRLIPSTERIGAAYSAADLVLARSGSSVWELAAAGKPAILIPYPFATADHQANNAEYFVKAGGAMMIRDLDLDDVPDRVRSLLDDPERLARDERGDAARRQARRGRGDRRGADRPCRRLKAGGSGSSGSVAPVSPRTRSSHAPGAPRSAAGTVCERHISKGSTASRSRSRPSRPYRTGWEVVVSSAYPEVPGTPRAAFLAELVAAAALDRRRRVARKGNDGRDDRVRPPGDGPRSRRG